MTDNPYFESVTELKADDPGVRKFRVVAKIPEVTEICAALAPGIPAVGSLCAFPDGPMTCYEVTCRPSPYREMERDVVLKYRKDAHLSSSTTWGDVDKIKAVLDAEAFRSLEVTEVPKGKPILIHLHVNTDVGVCFDEASLVGQVAELHKKYPDLPPFVLTQGPKGSVEIKTILDPRG